ncbi:enoyl-CoA hydratase/isomerase family protein [Sphingobacterium wenxiniae]|uniref:Enoyl-CoA hydratase n=1 Tax=Sphingobacterium wenxiniae TaxID=683125 RepID=A0A1I6UPH2_9SPHI|nr:enoyl-CoA hydratase-related protein [Sphingobacterium wenxiniae]SFT03303.1 enoyl-CoA hydratase [Sphingobacterium wenxiniae]
MWKNIIVEVREHTAYVTINRPDKLNALNKATLQELQEILGQLKVDIEVWGVLLSGTGDKAFVAGADIEEFVGLSATTSKELTSWVHQEIMDVLYHFPKPVIAAVNGFALGGGLELAMACHIRVASEQAKLGQPEVALGIIPGYGGTQRLPQLVGRGKAMEMILSGEMISATEALDWGLVNHVVPQEQLFSSCEKILEAIYRKSPQAVALAIDAVNRGLENPKSGYEREIAAFAEAVETQDFKEGVSAFLEKRKPNFR